MNRLRPIPTVDSNFGSYCVSSNYSSSFDSKEITFSFLNSTSRNLTLNILDLPHREINETSLGIKTVALKPNQLVSTTIPFTISPSHSDMGSIPPASKEIILEIIPQGMGRNFFKLTIPQSKTQLITLQQKEGDPESNFEAPIIEPCIHQKREKK